MATGTISSLGVGSGLDLNGMLDKLRAVDDQVITTKKNTIATTKSQMDEFTVVNNKLLTMKSSALDLSLSTTFLSRTVTSSSPSVFTATVADGTAAQSTSVTVNRLATKSIWMSAGKAAATTSVNTTGSSQNFSYRVGGTDITVAVANGTTLSGLVDLVNNDTDNPGVTASLINDGSAVTPYKLVLQTKATGSNQEITQMTAQLPDLAMSVQGQTGVNLNAQVTIDGVSYQRQGNAINDVLSGVTLNLQGAGISTVSVANNNDAVTKKVVDFVAAYNDAVQEVSKNTAYNNDTKDFGILARSTLRDLPYALENLMTSQVKADSKGLVTNMFDLGMAFNRDGTISIDTTKLSAAISASPDSVSALFLGDSAAGITGLGDKVNNYLREVTSDTGQIKAEKTAAQTRIDDMQLQIEDMTARLDKRYDMLTKQFVALDQYMSQMKSMGTYLTGQFNSLNGTQSGSSSN
ncbi:MAG: flagellar filament capping protein FliD [Deltaproteobacteria bacterium]|nr:flagellar filament capping protein FliD [Deltaproteobacteria bacterium]